MATGFSSKLRLTSSESALETADGFYRHCECRSGNYLLQSVHGALGEHRQYAERPLCAMNRRCRPTDAHACASFKQWLSRNSRSARSASASSKGRSCRHCSDRRKSQAGRNSASRHRTRNNLGLDRYTKGGGCGSPSAKRKLSGRQLEGCYSVADDSPAGSRIRASVANAVSAPSMSLPSRARSIIATCSSAISRSTTTARSAPACRARSASSPSTRCTGRKRRIVKRIVIR